MANGAQNASGTPAPAASHSGGHVVSARATTIGLMAILLWSFMAGTVRIVSENFGATLGSALIYTVGGILLLMFRRGRQGAAGRDRGHCRRGAGGRR